MYMAPLDLTQERNTRTVGPSRAKSSVAIATALVRRRRCQDTAEGARGARGFFSCLEDDISKIGMFDYIPP